MMTKLARNSATPIYSMALSFRSCRCCLIVLFVTLSARAVNGRLDPTLFSTPLYTPDGDAFVRRNGDRFNNRPLYGHQNYAVILAGDRPLLRFGEGAVMNGTFLVALVRGRQARWLQRCSEVTSRYLPGRMEWEIRDAAFGSAVVRFEAVPLAQGVGFAAHLRVENAKPGDRVIWLYGGACAVKRGMQGEWDLTTGAWGPDGERRDDRMKREFLPEDCRNDEVSVTQTACWVKRRTAPYGRVESAAGPARVGATDEEKSKTTRVASGSIGACSLPSRLTVADAGAWLDPVAFAASSGQLSPAVSGVCTLAASGEAYWAFQAHGTPALSAAVLDPEALFRSGLARAREIESQVVVDTPDARLNATVAVSNTVTDAVFREGIFTHSGMRWGVPLLGWRTLFGATVSGWHDRVKLDARLFLAHQITASPRTEAKADPRYLLTSQAPDSVLFGKGRIDFHQPFHYDMQSQFFDQLVHAWRATGDPELEAMLRPSLELDLDYIQNCFDPDGDGLYESYANTWPTDDQWYNGGGTAEETAYAYTAEKAALELARRAGDAAAASRHAAQVAKIERSFMRKLWIPSKQYVGGWVEQGGHERLHEDGWLYAIFCPIDAGLLTSAQAAQSLYYTEWGLEREKMAYGGERCWTSNWVPSKWSLREMWPGDGYHLALAYFQTGLAEEGWNLLRGTFPAMAFYGPVPGDLGHPNGGTDFNDCASLFSRAVVEGLFGYRPDYPNHRVVLAPQLPSQWDHASIRTPDFSLVMRGSVYRVRLTRPAALELDVPVRAQRLLAVTVNGRSVPWTVLPGYGCTIARIAIEAAESGSVEVALQTAGNVAPSHPVEVELKLGEKLPPRADVVEPPVIPPSPGHHWVEERVRVGDLPQRRVFKVHVVAGESYPQPDLGQSLPPFSASARWQPVPLSSALNGDIRTLFQQKYLSPRPNTASLRLATDGYSTWQEVLGSGPKVPVIDLSAVSDLMDGPGRLRSRSGVPFTWPGGPRNVALTSLWDNWPRQVTVPVNRGAQAASFLVCGFTNPMQGRIANAEIRFRYADGAEETVDLIPPFNFWSLCPFGGTDYNYARDGFALPQIPPETLQLGKNCRAVVLHHRLRPGVALSTVTLETLSQEVMIGLMGMTLLNPGS
jgi:hypothetical protein